VEVSEGVKGCYSRGSFGASARGRKGSKTTFRRLEWEQDISVMYVGRNTM